MNNRTLKRLLTALSATALLSGLSGCILDKTIDITPDVPDISGSEVTITVNIPGAQLPSTRSIAGNAGEAVVRTIDLLVFEANGSGNPEVLAQHAEGEIVSVSADADELYKVQFKANLTANAGATTLVIVANAADQVDGVVNTGGSPGAATGTNKQDILNGLTFATADDPATAYKWIATGSDDYTPVPMYGEYDITKGGTNTAGLTSGMKMEDIALTRMLARIDVINNAGTFTLTDVYLVNYNTTGYIAPAWDTADGVILKSGDTGYPYDTNADPAIPSAPGQQTGEANATVYSYTDLAAASGMLGEIYTYEANKTSGTEGNTSHTNAACLILKGTLSGDTTPYHYRVDFTAGTDAAGNGYGDPGFDPSTVEYMPLYRNFRYRLSVSDVTAPGYADFGDALRSLGIKNNLKADLLVVDESSVKDFVFDNTHYLGVGDPVLFGEEGGTGTMLIMTNYAYGWEIDTSFGNGTGIVYNSGSDWLTASRNYTDINKAEIQLTAGDNSAQDNPERTATVHIKAGNLRHSFLVKQSGATVLLITGPSAFTYTGGTQTYTITSYTSDSQSTTSPVAWTAEFSQDGGVSWSATKPEWLTGFTTDGTGGTATDYSATAAAFSGVSSSADDILKAAAVVGSSSSYHDLSTHGGTKLQNTANCYIVNAPGYYRLPLVYGNAIKDGETNSGSYTGTAAASSSTYLTEFSRNNNNGVITSPYFDNSTYTAHVVWNDANNLVTNLSITGSGQTGYLRFQVTADNIVQGNSVIAVTNTSGNIVWSWHIWVTPLVDADPDKVNTDSTKNRAGLIYDMMPFNLGWCSTENITVYGDAPRSAQVRITQTGIAGPLSETFTVTQNNHVVSSPSGNNPLWQWGRKDPMMPTTGESNGNKMLYNYSTAWNWATSTATLGTAIQNPHIMYLDNGYNWCNSDYTNLWNANETGYTANDATVVKTVYDPSPAGFVMPPSNTWTGFLTRTNDNESNSSYFNVDGSWDGGWNFYLWSSNNSDYRNHGTSFYPAWGYRSYATGGATTGTGRYWSAGPTTGNKAYALYMASTPILHVLHNSERGSAMSVRPAREQ